MTNFRFLQIHTLTPYAAALLNRDDTGAAKRLPFGGSLRTRISSQCLKRHWRQADHPWTLKALGAGVSLRSRRTFLDRIARPLTDAGHAPERVAAVVGAVKNAAAGNGHNGLRTTAGDASPFEELLTDQIMVLSEQEIEALFRIASDLLAGGAEGEALRQAAVDRLSSSEIEAFQKGAGVDVALFGRMGASGAISRVDAAAHVAHAFTVHAQELENDYFAVVDDLVGNGLESRGGLLGTAELTSGLFYGYVAVDVPLLRANLGGDRALAGQVVERLLHTVATVSPGGKRGATAPHAWSTLVLTEVGDRAPRSLANAFLRPVPLKHDADIAALAVTRLGEHLAALDGMYGSEEDRRVASIIEGGRALAEAASLDGLAAWAGRMAGG